VNIALKGKDNMTLPAVTINDIHKRFVNVQALSEVSFEIEKGSFFGLLGPNGAGKSTLINIMAGLLHASQGTIQVMGNDVAKDWRKTRFALGVVPQELVYDSFFTVREMLRLQSGYFGLGASNRAWINELIDILDLTEKADEILYRLSGGMKRRVLIAQALVHRPQVVVLDEPTAGVDVELRRVLWDLTRRLHEDGHTVLLTTHYLEEAEALCERIAILNHGKVVALDTTKAIVEQFPYRFLGINLKDPSVALPDLVRKRTVSLEGSELTLRLDRKKDNIGDFLEALYASNISFTDLWTKEPGLEDVFISLTGRQND
jgi:ABC-2 type transport system ATP-binding protein